jgi:hypothetical protein
MPPTTGRCSLTGELWRLTHVFRELDVGADDGRWCYRFRRSARSARLSV